MIRNITLTSIGHAACTIIRMILMLLMSLSDVNGNGLAAVIQFLILGIVQAVGISFHRLSVQTRSVQQEIANSDI